MTVDLASRTHLTAHRAGAAAPDRLDRIGYLDGLEGSVRIPVSDGLQAQGDLIVIPFPVIASSVRMRSEVRWRHVPPEGAELLRVGAGGNPHTLVAEPGTCRWTTDTADSQWLAIGMFETTAVAYLLHPEHGAVGCAPGAYVVRRQREHAGTHGGFGPRLVAD